MVKFPCFQKGGRTLSGISIEFVSPAIRRSPPEGVHLSPRAISSGDYRIQEVLRYLEKDPAKTVHELAPLVDLSDSRLGHLFKAETKVSLASFLTELRLEKAAQLLASTEMQIKEIASVVGYRQVPSFYRAFRNKFKMRPADYRARQQLRLNNGR